MLSSCNSFVSFHAELFSLISYEHLRFALLSISLIICCNSCFMLLLSHINESLPMLHPAKQVNTYASLGNELATCSFSSIRLYDDRGGRGGGGDKRELKPVLCFAEVHGAV
jgi:hypothetical protein